MSISGKGNPSMDANEPSISGPMANAQYLSQLGKA
jgi:hypothetical protein